MHAIACHFPSRVSICARIHEHTESRPCIEKICGCGVRRLPLDFIAGEVPHLFIGRFSDAANVVLVHCRNGQDRSCFAVYEFLRLVHHMDHQTALRHVYQRVDQHGYVLFDVTKQKSELVGWVHANLGTPIEAESGVYHWQYGST